MNQEFLPIAEIRITQYNMKQGLNHFIRSSVGVIKKEVYQLVTIDDVEPDNPKDIIREYCRSAMAYLILLKKKRDVAFNRQGCCIRRLQQNYMKNKETISPTVMQ